jgi:cytochrome c-type biogenesis protein CcmE
MSRIDDELEQAVRDAEGPAPERVNPPSDRDPAARVASARGAEDVVRPVVSDSEPKRGWGLLAGLGVLMTGILLLVFGGGEEAVTYSYPVDELQSKAAEVGARQVRVQGSLVSGTLVRRDSPCEYRFQMRKTGDKNGETLKVSYAQCIVPDQFRDVKGVEVEVTAEGRLTPDGQLDASKIFAKCPSKYEMRESAGEMGKAPDHGGGAPKPEFIAPRVDRGDGIR